MKLKLSDVLSVVLPLAVSLGIWEILGTLPRIGLLFPDVKVVLLRAVKILPTPDIQAAISVTLYETMIAFILAVAVGLSVGLLMGSIRLVQFALDPYLQIFLSFPKIVIYPVVFFIFGLDINSKIVFAFFLGVLPFMLNTMNGVRNIDPLLLDVARGFRSSKLAIFRKILVPAALPNIMTATEICFAQSLFGVVLAEVYGSFAGIGNVVAIVGQNFEFPTLYVMALTVFVLSFVGTNLIALISSKLTPWTKSSENLV